MIGRAATPSFNLFCWSRCLINSLQINTKTSTDCYEWSQRCSSMTKRAALNYFYNLKLVSCFIIPIYSQAVYLFTIGIYVTR